MSGLPPQSLPPAYRPRSSVRCSRWSCPSEPCSGCLESSSSWPRFEPGRGELLGRFDGCLGLARHHRVVPEPDVHDRLTRTLGLLLLFDLAPLFVASFSHGPQFL